MNKGRTNPLDILEEEPSGETTKLKITGDNMNRLNTT
jgi:hypothetical protein